MMNEIPPTMVLSEVSPEQMTFRFRNGPWGAGGLFAGLALVATATWLQFAHASAPQPVIVCLVLGALLLYSSSYSFTASQFLIVDGARRAIRFHKRNLYGKTDWERPASQFSVIRVYRRPTPRGPALNWTIMLVGQDDVRLCLGENEFGALHYERAIALARRVAALAGIDVEDAGASTMVSAKS